MSDQPTPITDDVLQAFENATRGRTRVARKDRQTPTTDAVADTAWDGASDDYSAYAKMLANARELEEKLQAECRSTMKLTNELLDVKLELAVATKQRDALLEALDGMVHCAESRIKPIATLQQAREAIAKAKGATP